MNAFICSDPVHNVKEQKGPDTIHVNSCENENRYVNRVWNIYFFVVYLVDWTSLRRNVPLAVHVPCSACSHGEVFMEVFKRRFVVKGADGDIPALKGGDCAGPSQQRWRLFRIRGNNLLVSPVVIPWGVGPTMSDIVLRSVWLYSSVIIALY